MNVIIRLQNLPWSANASDIRQYFKGLQIPEGGVHIVGGENGDAFIAFSSDEDARQAMALNGGKLKEVKVTLLLSSRAEMQKVIEKARAATAFMPTKMQLPSAEAFTNQFVNKKLPEAPIITNVIPNASQSLMANYLQHSASTVVPMMNNFQMKASKESILSQATAPQISLATNPQLAMYANPLYANMMSATPADYLSYMNMANATANYPIDANKLRDLYNKDKRVELPMQQKQHNDYNRYQRSSSRERQRSRSPMSSSRYDSDDKKDKKRRTRFSSPEKAGYTSTNNPLLQHIPPLIQPNPVALNNPKPQSLLDLNMSSMSNVSLNPVASNTKLPNNIWDVPPPLNLNTYTQFQPNAYNSSSSTNNSSGIGGVGKCIKVANIDKETTYSDVRKFFGGLAIGNNDIKFLTDENGDHTGVALIRFITSDSMKQSLTKNGWQLKSTQIMITSISEDDFENGLDSSRARSNRDNYKRDNNRRDNYDDSRRDRFRDRSDSRERNYDRNDRSDRNDMRSRGMNNNFNNRNNHNNNNYQTNRYNSTNNNNDRFERDRDRGSNGPANRNNGNGNFNNNRRESRRDNDSGRNRNFRGNEAEEKIEYIPDENFNVLVIDDIPDKNEADLFEAFPDILGITIDKYTAYCKFRTHEAAKAVIENRFLHYIRNKRVFVEKGAEAQYDDIAKKYGKFDNPEFADEIKSNDDKKAEKSPENSEQSTSNVDQEDKKKPVSRDPRQKASNNDRPNSNSSSPQTTNFKTDCILIKNLDLQSSIEDVEKFFADINIQKSQMRTHILLDKRGQPCGDCFVEFKYENDIQKAISKNNQQLGPNRVQILPIPREQVEAVLSSFGNDDSRQQNRDRPQNQNRDWAPPADFGNPGCVVMVSNLCYRASIDDILDEFREFELKADQIIRRYNDFGQPTGNACINFNTEEDATKACDEYNKVKILNRPVWLRKS
ncbi:unnamed protein product [Chironomus riparius]|uniref:RRM domain-containing protein n=1 Tax=Chironomus riparius TaxID=315576 RepID=A0A9N9RMQ8_9DIPT|nr:unnamed protein product [Chironomus riparius]